MLGIGVDITDLKKTEQSLQESEEKYLLLLNSTAEAIYGLDLEGDCTFCNPACLRLLGYATPKDLLGTNMHELVHHTRPDGTPYPKQDYEIYVAVREGRASHVTQEVLWRADGTSFPAEYWSYPMYKTGELVGAVVTFLDISDRKWAEQALRQSEEKYRELFENATYGIFRSQLDGALLDVNPALVTPGPSDFHSNRIHRAGANVGTKELECKFSMNRSAIPFTILHGALCKSNAQSGLM
jgi:PAS domain S-box-containing protein